MSEYHIPYNWKSPETTHDPSQPIYICPWIESSGCIIMHCPDRQHKNLIKNVWAVVCHPCFCFCFMFLFEQKRTNRTGWWVYTDQTEMRVANSDPTFLAIFYTLPLSLSLTFFILTLVVSQNFYVFVHNLFTFVLKQCNGIIMGGRWRPE